MAFGFWTNGAFAIHTCEYFLKAIQFNKILIQNSEAVIQIRILEIRNIYFIFDFFGYKFMLLP